MMMMMNCILPFLRTRFIIGRQRLMSCISDLQEWCASRRLQLSLKVRIDLVRLSDIPPSSVVSWQYPHDWLSGRSADRCCPWPRGTARQRTQS